ncbi:DUF2142 domain-containing protein [Telmatobacter sp. DSM 110680]|uniref:DUF2142 domain-containing protein n=1 Tax=Telmatobacter sp. DSM 110680 TaxID=3036704 RepID=A0AAU7DRS6_9BACT
MIILGAIGSIPLVVLTPPFQVPDEVQHFYRAYQLSDFRFRAEVQNGVSGGTLPVSLPELVKSVVYTRDGVFYSVTPAPLAKTLKLASIPLEKSTRRFIAFPGSAFYSPLPYLPQVVGISVGRLFGLGPLYLVFLGRLFNCLTALAMIGFAVYLIPIAGELVILIGLLPMSLFLYASLSPDAAVIACALLFFALSLAANTSGSWKTWELVMAAALGAVLCSVKPVYAPMLLAGVVPGLIVRGRAASVIRSHVILVAVAMGAAAGWLLFVKPAMTSPLGGGHPSLQMSFILHNPAFFMRVLIHTIGDWGINALFYYFSTVGMFGWLSVLLRPVLAYFLPLVNFVVIWSLGPREGAKRSVLRALWYLALAFASVVLAMTAMYLMSAHVGQNEITGLQGRYFIPILILAGMAAVELSPHRRPSARWSSVAITAAIIVLQIVATDRTIIHAFQVF